MKNCFFVTIISKVMIDSLVYKHLFTFLFISSLEVCRSRITQSNIYWIFLDYFFLYMISHLKKFLRFKNIYKRGKISVMNSYIPFSLLQHYQERAKLLSFLHFSLAFVFLKYITSLTFI